MLWLHTGILCNSRILIAIEWSQKQKELVSCFQWCIKHNCWLFFKLFQESHQHQGLLAGSCHLQRQQMCVISSVSLVIHVVTSYHSVMASDICRSQKLRNRPLLISATYFTLKRMLLITFQLQSRKCQYLMPLFQESKQCLYDITSYILLRYYFKRTVIDWKTVTTKEILMIWVW